MIDSLNQLVLAIAVKRWSKFIMMDQWGKYTAKCKRCGLRYLEEEITCPHCAGKTDAQIIKELHIPHSAQLKEVSKIGRQFFYLAFILGSILLLIF